MSALQHTDVPVPKMVDFCEDESILETDFNLQEPISYHKDQVTVVIDQILALN